MIPQGSIKARAVSMMFITSPNKGTPGVTVTFNITEEGPYKGQLREWTGWLTENTEAKTSESLDICGYDGSDPNTIKRNEVVLVIEHETYTPVDPVTGQPRARNADGSPKVQTKDRIRWVNDPNRGGASFPAMESTKQIQAQERLRGLMLARQAERAKRAVQ